MHEKLLNYLLCPFCGSDIEIEEVQIGKEKEVDYGLLVCSGCKSFFPVVEGIPIMMASEKRLDVFAQTQKKRINQMGITVSEISDLIREGNIEQIRDSIIYTLQYKQNTYPVHALPAYIEKMIGVVGKKVVRKILYSSFFDNYWSKKLKTVLESETTSAYDVMRIYYQSYELFNYFFYKFGQPRFLVSLGFASIIEKPEKPIMDLACGMGHLLHFLTNKYKNCPAIGLDRNFFQLFLGRKYIAPMGHYVCAEADEKLSFKEKTFSNIICSDAFHYLPNKVNCIKDLKNILQEDGTIIITRAGNQLVEPNEAYELSPSGYVKLFDSMPVKMVSEDSLLENYLNKKKPDLSQRGEAIDFTNQKWLSLVASNNKQRFIDYGDFDEWPHEIGHLALNPHYKKISTNEGNEHYKFTYPSEWYGFENAQWQAYTPGKVSISDATIEALKNNERNYEMDEFIDKFVILGFPEKYLSQKP